MVVEDLAVLAAHLRNDGLDARNLAQVGITIWEDNVGHFYPLAELRQNAALVGRRDFSAIRAKRLDEPVPARMAS